jgi:hypothetical protein
MPMGVQYILIAFVLAVRPSRTVEPVKPIALFNGQNLSGWTYHLEKPDVKPESVWSVQEGVLRCTGQPAGYLITKENNFENYALTLQWRWPGKGGNNGVLVHVTTPGELGVWPKCFEVQLASGQAGEFWVIGTTLEVKNPATHVEGRQYKTLITQSERPLGQWNSMEITCIRDEIQVRVNGYIVNQATKLSQQRGAIALQSEGAPIEFREIMLKKLAPNAAFQRGRSRPPTMKATP